MMNQALVAELTAIASEQRTGSLVIDLGARQMRFGFENGEMTCFDLGEEKQQVMARKLLDYHKVGPEMHRHAVNTARATGQGIIDILRRQQLVSDGEVDQVAQSMVEDLLATVFALNTSLSFNTDGADTYDTEKRAVRLRVDVASLLSGVEARLNEEATLAQEVGTDDAVFALAEGADAGHLDDFGSHLLTLIDGKRTLRDLAVSFRDSSLNMSRHLAGLLREGLVRRLAVSPAEKRSAQQAAASSIARSTLSTDTTSTEAGTTPAAAPAAAFEVYHEAEPQAAGLSGARIALIAVLIVVALLGYAVYTFGIKQGKVAGDLADIEAQIIARTYAQAAESLQQIALANQNNLDTVRQVEALRSRLAAALAVEVTSIEKALADEDFSPAKLGIARLPADHSQRQALSTRLEVAQADLEARVEALSRAVRTTLEAGDIAKALKLSDAAPANERAAAEVVIDRWRVNQLEQAGMASLPLGKRQQFLNAVLQARPNPSQKSRIEGIQEELLRSKNRRSEQLRQVVAMVERGAYREADTQIERFSLLDQAPGSTLSSEAETLGKRLIAVRGELEGVTQHATEIIGGAVTDSVGVAAVSARVQQLLDTYPEASNREDLERSRQLLQALEPIAGRGTTTEEIIALRTLRSDAGATLGPAIDSRLAALHSAETEADGVMSRASELAREARWDEAVTMVERLRTSVAWRRTPAGRLIDDRLADIAAQRRRFADDEAQLRSALLVGDVAKAVEVARSLGRPYLPMLVESIPANAVVEREGKEIGRTPLILDLPAAERTDLTLVISAPDHEVVTVSGASASGGWRLTAVLPRLPNAEVLVAGGLTATPTVIADAVWSASSSGIHRITAQTTVTSFMWGDTAPTAVVASPLALAGGVLVATRDRFAGLVMGDQVANIALSAATDHAPVDYRSPVVLDRHLLIVAGTDGALHAAAIPSGNDFWSTSVGASFSCAPVLVNERVLAVRNDGQVLSFDVERGNAVASERLGAPVLSAWADGQGLSGVTSKQFFHWNGLVLARSELPRDALLAGAGLLISRDRQVFIADGADWKLIGVLAAEPTGHPLRWGDRVAVPCGTKFEVIGGSGFRIAGNAAFLAPTLLGDRLVVTSSDGRVRFYAP